MAEYQVHRDSLTSQENIDEAAKKIVDMHKKPVMIHSEPTKHADPDDKRIRTIVREELAVFKAEVVKQVMSDIATQMNLRKQGRE